MSSCRWGCEKSRFLESCNNPTNYSKERIWGTAAENILGKPESWRHSKNAFVICRPPFERMQVIYRGCEGLLPSYGGHVPGEKFRVGRTFASSTKKAELVVRPQYYYPNC